VENSLGKRPLARLKGYEDAIDSKRHEIGLENSLEKRPHERLKRFEGTIETKLTEIGCDTGERNFPRIVPSGRLLYQRC
jgi:hypothetical protein